MKSDLPSCSLGLSPVFTLKRALSMQSELSPQEPFPDLSLEIQACVPPVYVLFTIWYAGVAM